MKKTITLAASLLLALGAYAQQEAGFIEVETALAQGPLEDFTDSKGNVSQLNALEAGTVLASSDHVTMMVAFRDGYKSGALTGDSDTANQVKIDGVLYDMPTGINGFANPSPTTLGTTNPEDGHQDGGQSAGAVYKFEVTTNGWLYVFGKISGNKSYYVWQGPVSDQLGRPVGYTLTGMVKSGAQGGTVVSYTLPQSEYTWYDLGDYDNGTALFSASCCYDVSLGKATGKETSGGWGKTWTEKDLLGVIAFPVYAYSQETGTGEYYVNACGSKLGSNGFVFIPCDDPIKTGIAKIEFTKGEGEAAIENVTVDADNENAPVYNINGQQVSKDTKGLLIQKGKKFYNR